MLIQYVSASFGEISLVKYTPPLVHCNVDCIIRILLIIIAPVQLMSCGIQRNSQSLNSEQQYEHAMGIGVGGDQLVTLESSASSCLKREAKTTTYVCINMWLASQEHGSRIDAVS